MANTNTNIREQIIKEFCIRKICIIPAFLAVILAIVACDLIDDISDKINPSATVSVTGVLLNKTSTSLVVGGTETLFANIEPSNASNKKVTWISGNTAVATVSAGGLVTGLSSGTATIIVTTVDKGKTTFCTVTVGNTVVPVTSVLLNKTSTSLVVGSTETLFTAIRPLNATNQSVTWSSSSPTIATVSEGGEVTGVSAGTATITVTTVDGGHQAACTVTTVNEGGPITVFEGNRYQAAPYTSNDKIKYSFSYNGYDYYYIYLGQLGNIPLFYDDTHRHSWSYTSSTYTFETTKTTTEEITNTVEKSSGEAVSITKEHTVSATTGGSLSAEIGTSVNFLDIFKIGGKITAEENWSNYTSDTSGTGFQRTTSLTDTVAYAKTNSNALRRSRDFVLTRADKEGYYRYTCFSVSDVYLYVIRDPAKPNEIYYEFKECIIPNLYFWDLDYSETPDFNKSDATKFGLDISILKRLPVPALTLSDPPVYPTGVSLDKSSINLDVGGKETLIATITPSNTTNNNVTWSSSNTSVAMVSATGTVTAVSTGSAIITVTTVEGKLTAACNVTIVDRPTGVSLNKTSAILEKGDTLILTATITPSNAANKNVTWSSSNTAVATVSTTGTVTAISTGSAIITVKTEDGNLTAVCNVTVSPPVTVYKKTLTDIQYVSDETKDYKFDHHNANLDLARLKAEGYNWVTIKLDFQIQHETTGYVGICIYSGTDIIRDPFEGRVLNAWDSKSDFDIGSGNKYYDYSWTITRALNSGTSSDFTNYFTVRWWARGSGWDEYYLNPYKESPNSL